MNRKNKITIMLLSLLLIFSIGYGYYYLNDYYPADVDISNYNTSEVNLVSTSNGLLLDSQQNSSALIFYPGAKVEYTAYIPLLYKLSENGIDCFIVKMPYNLAFFDKDAANDIITNDSYNYSKWYISGHSLGGAMGSDYVKNHKDNISGLILLASYPTDKIETPVLSIYGSNDNVLNIEKYQENKNNMPNNFTEYIIDGGNHAQFAYYGNQANDGLSTISNEEQINITVKEITSFINSIT